MGKGDGDIIEFLLSTVFELVGWVFKMLIQLVVWIFSGIFSGIKSLFSR